MTTHETQKLMDMLVWETPIAVFAPGIFAYFPILMKANFIITTGEQS